MKSKFSSFSLKVRYKIAKLLRLLPTPQKKVLSEFEDKGYRSKFYRQLWENAANNLGHQFIDLGYGYWCLKNDNGKYIKGNIHGIELDTDVSAAFAGNKPLTHKFVSDVAGYVFPRYCEFNLQTIQKANDFLNTSHSPCVVKPAQGTGAGNGVTMGVSHCKALERATIHASTYSKNLLIEQTVTGKSFRILILNKQYINAIRRDPPQVTGDGKSSISELIHKENQRRKNADKIISLFPITIDHECINTLKANALSLKSVPGINETIVVKNVINQNAAEQNIDVTDLVHPDIIKMSIEATKKLGLELAGIDVLTTDISLPLEETGGVVNEINSNPGLHHHYLISEDKDIDIAEKIIQHAMSFIK